MNEVDPPKKRLMPMLRVLLLFLLLVGGFAWYARNMMNQHAGSTQVYDNLAVFDSRLDNLENSTLAHEKRIKDLEEASKKAAAAAPAPAGTPSATPAPPDTASAAASNERLAALEKEIGDLRSSSQTQDRQSINQAIRMLSAFHRLSDKVMAGKPFASELSSFEVVASPDESAGSPLATLAPYADSGIPTFMTLLATFDQAVQGLNATQSIPPSDASFWERLKYNLAHLISVRRIDDVQAGTSAGAIVGRAQAHLENEEIEAAVAEIKALPDTARANFAAWLDDAQMVTEAPSVIDQLEEQVLQKAFHTDAMPAASAPMPQPTPDAKPAEPAPATPKT